MRRWGALHALPPLVLAAGALVACDGDSSGAQPSSSAGETVSIGQSPASGNAACTPTRPHEPGGGDETLVSGGTKRKYVLHIPPAYDGERPLPLVLNLHGLGSGGAQQAAYSRLPEKADAEGFIVVSPDGTGTPRGWDFLGAAKLEGDLTFFDDLLDRLLADLCVDETRVYAAGISNGALEAARLACRLAGRIAAVSTVATTVFLAPCDNERPVPLVAFHGTADTFVPFSGGPTVVGVPVAPAEEQAASWAAHNGCAADPARDRVSEHVERVAYAGCRDGAVVVLFVIEGGGHTWPGAAEVAYLGATTHELTATDAMWEFFASLEEGPP